MKIISLPDDLNLKSAFPIQIYDYQTAINLLNNKINLTKNTISFLIEGTKDLITDQDTITVKKSQLVFMKNGHCLMTEKVSPSVHNYKSVLLFFTKEVILEFIRKYNISIQKDQLEKAVQVFSFDDYLHSFVNSLDTINTLETKLQEKLLQVKFEELMLYLIEVKGTGVLNFLLANTEDHSRNFINLIERNKLNKLSLKELAFLSNRSVSTFKREFVKYYNRPPIKWFQDKRLEHSAFLLNTHKKRPIEIFEEAGYETLSNFVQAFKKKYGITPKQYQLES